MPNGVFNFVKAMLGFLIGSPLLSRLQLKVKVGDRLADLRPFLKGVQKALDDGKIGVLEAAELVQKAYDTIMNAEHVLKPPVAPLPSTDPLAPPPVVPLPPPIVVASWQVTRITFDGAWIEGERNLPGAANPNAGEMYDVHNHVQMIGERTHLFYSSWTGPNGQVKIPDEVNRRWMADGHSPLVQPRWGRILQDGTRKMNWNSQDEKDHWQLQAYDKLSSPNAGWTHVLELVEQGGPGTFGAFGYLELPADLNSGLAVRSDGEASWRID